MEHLHGLISPPQANSLIAATSLEGTDFAVLVCSGLKLVWFKQVWAEELVAMLSQKCFINVCVLCYLERFVEEGLHSLRQTSNQSKRVSQNVQTQNQNIHLLQELQPETTTWSYIRGSQMFWFMRVKTEARPSTNQLFVKQNIFIFLFQILSIISGVVRFGAQRPRGSSEKLEAQTEPSSKQQQDLVSENI